MKRLLLNLLVAALPVFAVAQQKNTGTPQQQEQFKKEMEAFQKQMQDQVNALQDSVAKLKQQLNERAEVRMKGWEWSFHNMVPDLGDESPEPPSPPSAPGDKPRSYHYFNYKFPEEWSKKFETPCVPEPPSAPEWNYKFEIPPLPAIPPLPDFNFDFKMPYVPQHEMKKHKQNEDFLEMLPFYNLFKS